MPVWHVACESFFVTLGGFYIFFQELLRKSLQTEVRQGQKLITCGYTEAEQASVPVIIKPEGTAKENRFLHPLK